MIFINWKNRFIIGVCMIVCACSKPIPPGGRQMISRSDNIEIYTKVLARFLNKYMPTHVGTPKTFYLDLKETAMMSGELKKLCNVEIKPGARFSQGPGMLIDNDTGLQCGKLDLVDAMETDGRRFIGVAAIIGNMGGVGISYRVENRPGGWEIVEERFGFSM
jgi:hypothetical protein